MLRTFVLTLLFIAVVPLASGGLRPEQESEFWKDSGLDLAFAAKLINDQACLSSEQYYDSCRRAIYAGSLLVGHAPQYQGLRSAKFPKKIEFGFLLTRVLQGATATLPAPMILGRMITAQLQVFDKYAQLLPTDYYRLMLNGDSKTYYGLGIETEISGAGLHIFRVHPNTPAAAAGVLPGDRIVSVNGIMATNLEEAKAISEGLGGGKRDATVILEVARGTREIVIELKTAPIALDDIDETRIEADEKVFGFIRLLRFGQDSCKQIQNRLDLLAGLSGKLGGVVLDLRHNAGGMVSEGSCIAQLFLGNVPVVTREPLKLNFPAALDFPTPALSDYTNLFAWRSTYRNFPLVVLIDAESKSMSEVVAGSLQGYRRAFVVGERSYGKSTTQIGHILSENPKLRVIRTVSRFQLPSGIARPEAGIAPDFEIPFQNSSQMARREFLRETHGHFTAPVRPEHKDPKLGKCIQGLRSEGRELVLSKAGFADEQMSFSLAFLRCLGSAT